MGTVQIDGSTPKLTIGNATAEDATILFDGNAQDFYIALDDSADDLLIGLGSTVGTTPIIAIDENKLSTFSGAITVGVNDAGHDVKFFGDTASAYMLWDTSADDLVLAGAAGIDLAGNIDVDGTANLDVVDIDGAVQIDGTVTVGVDNTGLDVKFFGATSGSYMLWDESADDLNIIAGGLGVGTAKDLGATGAIHIRGADSGASVNSSYNNLVIENDSTTGISILSGTSSTGAIIFGDSGDNDIGQIRYLHASDSMKFTTNTATGMVIDSTGAVTKPLQPAFQSWLSANQSDIATSGTTTIVFDSEAWDNNADFNTGTYTFTAPVAGRYLFTVTFRLDNVDTAASAYYCYIVTSNATYQRMNSWNTKLSADPAQWQDDWVQLADMDASDTVHIAMHQGGGTAQTDVIGGARTESNFCGFLVC